MVDVVITSHPKDYEILSHCVNSVVQYVPKVRRIYIISPHSIEGNGIIHVPETKFPFSREDVYNTLKTPNKEDLTHWYLQQLLKIYSFQVIPELSENILIIDSDVVLLKEHRLFDGTNPIFAVSDEMVLDKYAEHMKRLHDSFDIHTSQSGVTDYQVWNKHVWKEMIEKVEKKHNKPFWKVFLEKCVTAQDASEYEMYFQYFIGRYDYNVVSRKTLRTNELSNLTKFKEDGYDSVSLHRWIGPRK